MLKVQSKGPLIRLTKPPPKFHQERKIGKSSTFKQLVSELASNGCELFWLIQDCKWKGQSHLRNKLLTSRRTPPPLPYFPQGGSRRAQMRNQDAGLG